MNPGGKYNRGPGGRFGPGIIRVGAPDGRLLCRGPCGQFKPESDFYVWRPKRARTACGRLSVCKACDNARRKNSPRARRYIPAAERAERFRAKAARLVAEAEAVRWRIGTGLVNRGS